VKRSKNKSGDPVSNDREKINGEPEARRIVRRSALASALAGASPIPLGGFAGVPAIQAKMLVELAKQFGRPLDLQKARDMAGFLGGSTALQVLVRWLTRTAAARLPAVRPAAGAASAFGSTFALGLVAIRYFRPDGERDGTASLASNADRAGFEREARTLRLEWESGAISEGTYLQDLEALREKFASEQADAPRDETAG
jgi:uncharacterized protein (DUF697 family)